MYLTLQELVMPSFFGVQDSLKDHSSVLCFRIFHQKLSVIDLDLERTQHSEILEACQSLINAIFVIIEDRVL